MLTNGLSRMSGRLSCPVLRGGRRCNASSLPDWGGLTTHDLHRCQLSASAVALIYNWWSLFVRLANPAARREAITSRPWLMASVGRKTEHAGQTTITLTGLHTEFTKARDALTRVSAMLHDWAARVAEQFNVTGVWNLVCAHLKRVLAGVGPPKSRRSLQIPLLAGGQLRFLG